MLIARVLARVLSDHAYIQMLIRGLFGVYEGHLDGLNQTDPLTPESSIRKAGNFE